MFSFEKITDANAALSPEMKSTGEVLGLGKNLQEALFKGLVSAGYKVEKPTRGGVLISVNRRDQPEIVNIARKLDDMGYKLYATDGTGQRDFPPGHRCGDRGQAGPGQPGVPDCWRTARSTM